MNTRAPSETGIDWIEKWSEPGTLGVEWKLPSAVKLGFVDELRGRWAHRAAVDEVCGELEKSVDNEVRQRSVRSRTTIAAGVA